MSEDPNREDAPLRVAIVGAGPIGIEAALYARYLGYQTAVLDKGEVACNVRRWGHVRMFSPFGMNRSPLGVAALQAQDKHVPLPSDEEWLTGREYVDRYLLPLSRSDLLSDCIFTGVNVVSMGRDGVLKSDLQGIDRSQHVFRILVEKDGREEIMEADVVIDASGVYDTPNYVGHGGMPCLGERRLRARIDYHLPDVLGADAARFRDKEVLVVGSGYSAATSVVALRELQRTATNTDVTWITRRAAADGGPITRIADDRLPLRDELAQQANQLAHESSSGISYFGQTVVLAISETADGRFDVRLGGRLAEQRVFDAIVAHVGFRPDSSIHQQLQVHQCHASEGPMKLAASLLQSGDIDCLEQTSPGPEVLKNPEPGFYILGSKSYGRNSNFLLSVGFQQIRDVFTIIGERDDLDLYRTMEHLLT